jgi:hypothetical protein
MKSTLAPQFEAPDVFSDLSLGVGLNLQVSTGGAQPNTIRLPTFGNYVYAATARKAGRINARAISDAEHESLLAERQSLLDAMFNGRASRKDELRLEYVRWSLDRIEDAKHGEHLDRLEEVVVRYEHFLSDLQSLREQLEGGNK